MFSRVPPVSRAWLAAPDSVKRDGSAISVSPAISELTTPLAISNAVSSNGARDALAQPQAGLDLAVRLSRAGASLVVLSGETLARRLTTTSLKSSGSQPSELSKVIETSAIPSGPRLSDPAKITSSIALPRRCLALCSPMHQRMASTMLDLPHPLGPTMPTMS